MSVIKFGTDGWRAIIAQEYTVANVERISEATAQWMLKKKMTKVVIGYDCRFGGRMFSEVAATVFGNYGIKVFLSPDFVSTPMVSLGVVKTGSDLGVVITASHNPPSYNGYKLKSSYGGPTIPSDIEEVESLVPETSLSNLPSVSELRDKGLIDYLDLEQMYIEHVRANFDLDKIKSSGLKLAYDGMYGAGQNVIRKLFPDALLLHCDFNPSFMGQAPEPIEKNLKEIAGIIANNDYNLGLANDGDADRIGLFDEDGRFVDSHHILLLLLYYMFEYKKMTGKVVITFSVTDKMKKLAELYGLECEVTKIGFKYIAEIMTHEDVLVGGEESGGLAVKGHIPERDGVWMGILIMEFMAVTGKSIKQLIAEVYEKVGSFSFERDDHHITNAIKDEVMRKCKDGEVKMLGSRPVVRTETIDGYKFYLNDDEWIMVRASGTEPVLRIYAQTPTTAQSRTLLEEAAKSLMG
ncbi:MAG: phosphoglucomutase/phosphomannomutase family protein [Saprospiraceae bacterium]|nr:phosphoglucomutase/phosphomannomutase family protein [Saprospiraceae bacterium]MBK7787434.1 phosphoglucomutase/phosphomannomutase family protein [Saprospiraceae bacterium]MBK9687816.1 phosphoglucomutase/phosphomannomutase family protein [Saprospiraceae bacterium]MBL0083863.1 phosphoglucomutase/phosphomannomutase family protein [Saprospiraceae bacterium]